MGTCSTSKESSEHQQFRFEIKPEVLPIKSLKEINVFEICPNNFVGSRQTRTNFWTVVQGMLKMTEKSLIQHNFTVKLGSLCSQHVCNLTFLGQFFQKKKKNGPIFPKKEKERKKQNFFQDFKGILAKSLENLTFLGQFFQKEKKKKKKKNRTDFSRKREEKKKTDF